MRAFALFALLLLSLAPASASDLGLGPVPTNTTLTAPGPIGSTTPSSGAFTTIAGTGSLIAQGLGSIGSAAVSTGSILIVGSNNVAGSLLSATSQSAINADMKGSTAATVMTRCFKGNVTLANAAYTSASAAVYWADNPVFLNGSNVITRNYGFISRPQTAGANNFGMFYGTDGTTTATGNWAYYNDTANPMYVGATGLGLGSASTATAGTTTALVGASPTVQIFTGTTTQTVTLPAANALGTNIAQVLLIKNNSTGALTVNRAGADTINTTSNVTSFSIASFASAILVSDGSASWNKL